MQHAEGFLTGESTHATCVSDVVTGHYDVLIAAPSWDERCMCITQAKTATCQSFIILDLPVRDLGKMCQHTKDLEAFVGGRGRLHKVSGEGTAPATVRSVWRQLLHAMTVARLRARRPLRICMDISTCPRFLSLAVLGRCVGTGLASSVDLFYAEGHYPDEALEGAARQELFTCGRWNTINVPGYIGKWDPWKKRMYLVSLGFEGAKTLRVVTAADPDRVCALLPEPGVLPGYTERMLNANRTLTRQYCNGEKGTVRAAAGDAIDAWRALSEGRLEQAERENVYYLCCGTKPHAIALGLRAKVLEYPAVLYNIPESYRAVATRPTGMFWMFRVIDLSCAIP